MRACRCVVCACVNTRACDCVCFTPSLFLGVSAREFIICSACLLENMFFCVRECVCVCARAAMFSLCKELFLQQSHRIKSLFTNKDAYSVG